ncbi:ABC transporter permease [Streptomyces sp. NPDC047976]|uniref:ABC transporter permease n=1 Tax=Streptomyces sp. NPDC047976 TaxID=3155746 RepID=UPI00343E7F88
MSAPALKGPYWATVRQHRHVVWALPALAAVGLAAVAALRVWAGDPGPEGPFAYRARSYQVMRLCMEYAGTGLLLLPLLVGAFAAGPMTARELESGTWRLALTQSTTPRAWLGAKVLVAGAVSALGAAALVLVFRLGWTRVSGTWQLSRFDRGPYEATGPVLAAYCLLGVALGVLVGQLVRRTVAAMAVTGLLTGLVLLGVGSLRWSFLPVETNSIPFAGNPVKLLPRDSLLTDMGLLTASGSRLPNQACFERTLNADVCPADLNVTGRYADFHPASHYWPTQLIETAVVLALAAAALYAAFRVLRARRG